MFNLNKVMLIGNLGKNPEVRHLENGKMRTSFTLATSDTYTTQQGEKINNTEWHNIVLWTPLAEIAEKYLAKGDKVYIEGKITTRSYKEETEQYKTITEIMAKNIIILNNKTSTSTEAQMVNQSIEKPGSIIDELPF